MKKKWLNLAAIAIMGVSAVAVPVCNVQAVPSFNSSYWQRPLHPRKVITTKRVRIWKINANVPGYEEYPMKKKWLKKGSVVRVSQLASWPWGFEGHISGVGPSHGKGYFWVYNKSTSNWLAYYNKKNLKKYAGK
ncbi:hypothetical protein PT281_00525 [Lactobacillus sp. ESL0701]|uniref:hypothetical protein n=1 Tax=Lactobacillus sp. ESL0701 TaxID=2983217 RepID=UPI0023F878D2|nr:hypothetical protein [Lactobacillus sp. ESL0701]MDF7671769.1 hypothetical protein [Lactobacillus sp. ESL0701]